MTRSAGTGSRTWLMPALRSSRSNSMDGGADSFSLNQPSRLKPRERAWITLAGTLWTRFEHALAGLDARGEPKRTSANASRIAFGMPCERLVLNMLLRGGGTAGRRPD